jgi:hypothetical protein
MARGLIKESLIVYSCLKLLNPTYGIMLKISPKMKSCKRNNLNNIKNDEDRVKLTEHQYFRLCEHQIRNLLLMDSQVISEIHMDYKNFLV